MGVYYDPPYGAVCQNAFFSQTFLKKYNIFKAFRVFLKKITMRQSRWEGCFVAVFGGEFRVMLHLLLIKSLKSAKLVLDVLEKGEWYGDR